MQIVLKILYGLSIVGFGVCDIQRSGIRKIILENYDPDVRPNEELKRPVAVSFEMKMQTLDGFDIKSQTLRINAFNLMVSPGDNLDRHNQQTAKKERIIGRKKKWVDQRLVWNASEYNDVNKIIMSSELIWTPDIILYNTGVTESLSHLDIYKAKVTVDSNGSCSWNARATWFASCSATIKYFPMDTQECTLTFGSWSYTLADISLDFRSKPSGKSEVESDVNYVENGEWEITDLDATSGSQSFGCCPEPFSVIEYTIKLKRMYRYYFLYILLPLVSLSLLFLLVFHIPPVAGERMGFGVTILLSITVYLLVISEKLPEKSDEAPMLGVCFIFVFYLLCVGLGFAAMTVVFSNRTEKPPNFLLKLISNNGNAGKVDAGGCTDIETNNHKNVTDKQHKNMAETEEEKINCNEEWVKICRYFDKRISLVLLLIIIVVPATLAAGI